MENPWCVAFSHKIFRKQTEIDGVLSASMSLSHGQGMGMDGMDAEDAPVPMFVQNAQQLPPKISNKMVQPLFSFTFTVVGSSRKLPSKASAPFLFSDITAPGSTRRESSGFWMRSGSEGLDAGGSWTWCSLSLSLTPSPR